MLENDISFMYPVNKLWGVPCYSLHLVREESTFFFCASQNKEDDGFDYLSGHNSITGSQVCANLIFL